MTSRKRKRDEIDENDELDDLSTSSMVSRGASFSLDASDSPDNVSNYASIDENSTLVSREDIMNDDEIAKYWPQRYTLFSRFDDGVVLDRVGWYSVTPEAIAFHTANRFLQALGPNATVIDAMCGVGGNCIQLATYFDVIAIDLSEERLNMAKHNARLYGVSEKIRFIKGDFFELAPTLKADAVFLSPPWGGPAYSSALHFDLNVMDGFRIFDTALKISPNVAYYLPRNVDDVQLLALARSTRNDVEKERCYLNNRLKAVTAYFGILAGADHVEREVESNASIGVATGDGLDHPTLDKDRLEKSRRRGRKQRKKNIVNWMYFRGNYRSGDRGRPPPRRQDEPPPRPCHKIVCLNIPRHVSEPEFNRYFEARPGFVKVAHRGNKAFLEFADEPSATAALRDMHGRRIKEGATIHLDYDKFPDRVVPPGKRERSRSPPRAPRTPSPAPRERHVSSNIESIDHYEPRPTKRSRLDDDAPEPRGEQSDNEERGRRSDADEEEEATHRNDAASAEEVRVISDGRSPIDSAAWLTTVLPFWESAAILPDIGNDSRVEQAEKMSIVKASKFLKVSGLPSRITLNELCLLFRFAPNCLKVSLRRREGVAIIEFLDQISAHISMVAFNDFDISPSTRIELEYFK